ncbi:MAG TPA: hypothetical protein VKG44_06775 [Candidatus Baltobacteraceae bacterium]|nr:hypothetical protein [Candidatus Baltobacteraceae bacterium]
MASFPGLGSRVETDVRGILKDERFAAGLAALVALGLLLVISRGRETAFNNYVLLANAWLEGHPWIHFPGDYIDAMPYHGKAYIVEAPLPAVLLLPAVWAWGTDVHQTWLSVALGALGIYAAWRVARLVGAPLAWTAGLVLFLLFGTSYAHCAASGDVWFLAQVGGVAFTLLAIAELLGKAVPWRVTLWALCACFCRYPMFLALPFYALALWPQLRSAPRRLLPALGVGAAFAIPSAFYNYIRWGTIVDIGFTQFYKVMVAPGKYAPPAFSTIYIPMQIKNFFTEPPRLLDAPPYVAPTFVGMALTYTSPGLLLAFAAPIKERFVQLMWLAAIACAVPNFVYYTTGVTQFGARHALDFIPFLFVLMAFAVRRRRQWWAVPLVAWSVLFGMLELYVWVWEPWLVFH